MQSDSAIRRLCRCLVRNRTLHDAFSFPRRVRFAVESLEDRTLLSAGPIPIKDFAGIPYSGGTPDPINAAGPDNVIAMVNYEITIFDKRGPQIATAGLGDFFDDVDHGAGFQIFDPWIVYDRYSDRYVAMAAERELGAGADEAYFLIGISTSSSPDDLDVAPGDADNDWYVYSVNAGRDFGNGPTWADYPRMAVDADSIYFTSNNLTFNNFMGGLLVTRLNKIPMLSGSVGALVQIDGSAAGLLKTTQPVQSIGRAASEPQLFVSPSGWSSGWATGVAVWELDDSNNLTSSASMGSPYQGAHFAPQADTHGQIISAGSQLMNAVWRDNSLWTTHAVSNVANPTETIESGAISLSIPDAGTMTSTLSVANLDGLLDDVNVKINIDHSYDSDLDVYLISPSGTRVELFTDVGGSDDNFTDTVLDDTAKRDDGQPSPITGGTAPFKGNYRPEGFLAVLEGEDPNGLWTLEITDDSPSDTGTLVNWSLTLRYGDATVRWYEIDTTGGSYSLVQQGDIDPGPGIHTFFPAIAVDASGNMAISYTQSSFRQYPNMMVAGRRASDPPGYTTPGVVVRASESPTGGPLEVGGRRWGDYGGMAIDPADDATFWAFHEYATGTNTWGTWWGAFAFDTTSIYGSVWQDLDGDGIKIDSEPKVASWPVFLDGNNNGVVDEDLVASVTSTDVPILIPDAGTMTSRLEVEDLAGLISDVNVTVNIAHPYDADLNVYLYSPSGTRVELFSNVGSDGDDFNNTTFDDQASTSITAGSAPFVGSYRPEGSLADFDGERARGTWTLEVTDAVGGDVGTLLGWTLSITYGDTLLLTWFGDYVFTDLPPGTHVVREVPQPGWVQTAPEERAYVLDLEPGQAATHIDFGNAEPAEIHGTKWHDLDGDGVRDTGEPGLAGWTVFLDANRNGLRDQTTHQTGLIPDPVPIPDQATIAARTEIHDLDGLILDVNVTLDITHEFDNDLEVYLISAFGTRVELFTSVGGEGDDFSTTTLDDEATTSIGDGTAPFSGSYQPEGSLADFDGENPNGVWRLEVTDSVGGDVGTLNDWSITLTYGDPAAVTDTAGDYSFPKVAPGAYLVREEPQAGWLQTLPTDTVLYGAAGTNDTQLVAIDPMTGGALPVGATGVDGLMGLASDGVGTLYSIPLSGTGNRKLQSINPVTGEATPLFSVGSTGFGEGGLALTPGGAFAYGVRTFLAKAPELFRVDLNTKAITHFGSLIQGGGSLPGGANIDGLAFRGWTLYGLVTESAGSLNDHLVIIDTTTLQVTDVGSLGVGIGFLGGLAYDPDTDQFYVSGLDNDTLFAIDPATGAATRIGPTGSHRLTGLALGSSRGTPLAESHVVFAESNGNVTGVDFGSTQPVVLHGTKWHDLDGDGVRGDEPPLAGWSVYLDQNGNRAWDQETTIIHAADAPKAIPDLATRVSSLSVGGIVGQLVDVDVALDITHTFDGDLEAVLYSPAGTRVPLFYRVGGAGANFTATTLDDEAATPIGSGSAPFTGYYQPADPLAALDGEDANGIWTLELTDHAQGDTGTLNGWSLTLISAEPVTITDPAGEYLFEGLPPGGYTVREVSDSGWVQTSPAAAPSLLDDFEDGGVGAYTAVSGTGGFANAFATHDGTWGVVGMDWMYRDDADATVQRGDVISSWIRFANNATGQAWLGFGASASGTLALVLAPETGQLLLRDNPSYAYIDLAATAQQYEADHWYRAEVVWGVSGAIEGRLYDSDGTTLLSTVRAIDTVTTSGGIALRGDGTGSIKQFDTITIHRDGGQRLVLGSGEAADNADFGNARPTEIVGMKYHDLNGNGQPEGNEPRLPGWTVFLDADNDSILDDQTGTFASVDIPKVLPDLSMARSTLTVFGLSGLLLDVNVTLDITHTHDADLDVFLISPLGTRVELLSDVGASGSNFVGTTLDDEAAVPITSGTAPFVGSFQPRGSLADFDGQDPNGVWTLEITDDDALDTGSLGSWSITFTHGDLVTATDGAGEYLFGNLTPGEYVVREAQELGWIQTAPTAGFHDVAAISAEPMLGIDFGNRLPWLAIDNVAVNEGNVGQTNLDFTVTLLDPSDLTVTVQYKTLDGTATRGDADYNFHSGQLTFIPHGTPTQTIRVVVNGDLEPEADESFVVELFAPVNATLRRDHGVGTILNDDTVLPGDFNGNGRVEQGDLDLVLLNWGSSGAPPPTGWIQDLPDSTIDQNELDRVKANWGNTASFASAATVADVNSVATLANSQSLQAWWESPRNAQLGPRREIVRDQVMREFALDESETIRRERERIVAVIAESRTVRPMGPHQEDARHDRQREGVLALSLAEYLDDTMRPMWSTNDRWQMANGK